MMRNDRSFLKLSNWADMIIRYAGFHCWRCKPRPILLLICLCVLIACPAAVMAQDNGNMFQHTMNNPDQAHRSKAHVDPATHGMSIQIPLGTLSGRAGLNLPISITYSSKVWRIGDIEAVEWPLGGDHYYNFTSIQPRFGEYSAAGWTSSLNPPRIEYTFAEQGFSFYDGQAGGTAGYINVIGRIHVHMPDGSTHELRKSDEAINSLNYYPNGIYNAVDGSQLRYDYDAQTLFLPDGSRYVFETVINSELESPVDYIDRNGNKISYDPGRRHWTDTLGRVIGMPLPSTASNFPQLESGEETFTLPGVNGVPLTYKFYWRQLSDPEVNGEALFYVGNYDCSPPINSVVSPALFHWNGGYPNAVMCAPSVHSGPDGKFNPVVLSKIELPNGTFYSFRYNAYGEIIKIDFPTGGYERFDYGRVTPMTFMKQPYDQGNRGVENRWVSADGVNEDRWQYGIEYTPDTYTHYITTMTAPDLTVTKRILWAQPVKYDGNANKSIPYNYGDVRNGKIKEEYVFRPDMAMLRRTLTEWTVDTSPPIAPSVGTPVTPTRNPRVTKQVEIILDTSGNALTTTTTMQYDIDLNLISTRKYGYTEINDPSGYIPLSGTIDQMPQGTLLRTTEMTYLVNDNNIPVGNRDQYRARHLISLPTSTRIKDGAGALVAESKMSYDQTALFTYSAITGWSDPETSYRGNLTSKQSWLHYPGETDSYLTTSMKYDQCGNIREATDARQNKSTIQYSSANNLHAYPEQTTSPDPDGAGPATALVTSSTYDTNNQTGLLLSNTDANNQTTYFHYDNLNRLQTVNRPTGGGMTTYIYGDFEPELFVRTQTQIDASQTAESILYFDGLGRPKRSLMSEGGTSYTATDTKYDAMGRVWKVSNPYRTTGTGSNYQGSIWTTTGYDYLGRVSNVHTVDGAQVFSAYDGNTVKVTDQDGKDRQSTTDALGRLIEVVEDPGGQNYLTTYSYDALDNLTRVEQDSQEAQQVRIFKYDSLKRLRSAQNPESGIIRYEYDENGNLVEKKDARNLIITYSYDKLNRVTLRHYSDATPEVMYTYDQSGVTNSKGRLTSVTTGSGITPVSKTSYGGFDAMGRATASTQLTSGQSFQMSYEYDLADNLTSQTYPSGRKVLTSYDSAARINQVNGEKDSVTKTYASTFTYSPHGAVEKMKLGNGLFEHTNFNSRLQPTEIGLGTTTGGVDRLKLSYHYGTTNNNGNVRRQVITVPDVAGAGALTVTQHYQYDELNRLSGAQEVSGGTSSAWQSSFIWQQMYGYDRYGNRTSVNSTVTGGQLELPTYEPAPAIDPVTNRFKETVNNQATGFDYDAAGNLKQEPNSSALMSYSYDGDNHLLQAKQGTEVFGTYTYDGDGQRVKKVVETKETIFVYNIMGQLVAEYENEVETTGGTSYLTVDHLGSTRLVTDQSKAVKARHDYLPYGEEIATTIGGRTSQQQYQADTPRQKFTGKERDNETGLDYFGARYYSSLQGRFTSPDDFLNDTHVADPASWNLYVYVRNNPLRFIDPTGETVQNTPDDDHKLSKEQMKRIEKDLQEKAGLKTIHFDKNGKLTYDKNEKPNGGSANFRQAILGAINDSKNTFNLGDYSGSSDIDFAAGGPTKANNFNVMIDFKDFANAREWSDSTAMSAFSIGLNIYHEIDHWVSYDPNNPLIPNANGSRDDIASTRGPGVIDDVNVAQKELTLMTRAPGEHKGARYSGPDKRLKDTHFIQFNDAKGKSKYVRWKQEGLR